MCFLLKRCRMKTLTVGLTIVRHGETQFNQDGIVQGQGVDCPLSEKGFHQAQLAGSYLKDVKFSNVFASDLSRARQTAEKIVEVNPSCSGLQMVCDPLLKEKSFGIAEGKLFDEFQAMAKASGVPLFEFIPPNGETSEQVKERVKKFLEKMIQQIGSEHCDDEASEPEKSPVEGKADDGVRDIPIHALVVTHGALISVAVRYFVEDLKCSLPHRMDKAFMYSISPNTGLSRFILRIKEENAKFFLSEMDLVFLHRIDHVRQRQN